jgi:hypothetical protein
VLQFIKEHRLHRLCTGSIRSIELLPVSLGTIVGKHEDSCLGAQYAIDPNNCIAACKIVEYKVT